MGKNSKIEWTTHTFNPWVGCCKISEGCKNCYAETLMTKKTRWSNAWGPKELTQRIVTTPSYWNQPIKWNSEIDGLYRRPRVFCGSLCDVFEDHPDVEYARKGLWKLIEDTPNLDWLLLTKRPENVNTMIPPTWRVAPKFNVWIGVSVENQKQADNRLKHFKYINTPYPFISYEPALEVVHWDGWEKYISWIIVGGESGTNARPMPPGCVRVTKNWAEKNDIAFFFKQWGEWMPFERKGSSGNYYHEAADGKHHNFIELLLNHDCIQGSDTMCYLKLGKVRTGHFLNGIEYHEFPD